MKTIFVLSLLLTLCVSPSSAQVSNKTYNFSQKESFEAIRQQIGLDYSMPDYDTTSIDPNVIGVCLAKMLEQLKKSYLQNEYNHLLSNIRDEQITDKRAYAVRIHELDVKRLSKKDNVITILLGTVSIVGKKQKCSNDICLSFVDGISESMAANELFSQLGRYLKKD